MYERIRIGSRKSLLAKAQSSAAAKLIEDKTPLQTEMVWIVTTGDKMQKGAQAQVPALDKVIFIKEIEAALMNREIDCAVHSLKDLPVENSNELFIAAIPQRSNPLDVFIGRDVKTINELLAGARIGTGSMRRKAFLRNRFPGLEITPIRGNVDTRLKKIEKENLDGIILAAAGLIRLGYEKKITQTLKPGIMLPAPGQGAIAIQCRRDNINLIKDLKNINDPVTNKLVRLERSLLEKLGGGCQTPTGIYAERIGEGDTALTCEIVSPDGKENIRNSIQFDNKADENVVIDQMMLEIEHSGALKLL